MNIVFFNDKRDQFLPLVYTKPLAKLRIGILRIEQKWKKYFEKDKISLSISYLTEDYLSTKFPFIDHKNLVFVNSRFLPNKLLVDFITNNLIVGEAVVFNGAIIAAKCTANDFKADSYKKITASDNQIGIELESITDIFRKNDLAISIDFQLLTENKRSEKISATNKIIGDNIFIEEGAKVEASVLNSSSGPIYIAKNAEIMEGSLIRGPFVLCKGGILKMGTKIYGPTTIGKYSKVGGEVNNCVIQDYSNKGHDGFLGNSVIGEWCNLGADTNTSNLKNNYGEVKLWSYSKNALITSGLQFCGLIMGDHSKCGINTMFNTGTTVGVSANIFGSGFPNKFIPSYSWGGTSGFDEYNLAKMFEVTNRVMSRRAIELTTEDKTILTAIFEMTAKYR